MKATDVIVEANPAAKVLPDPKMTKMLAIAIRHDETLPKTLVAKLGPKPTDQDLVKLWSVLIDQSLSNTNYGDLSRDGKFDGWLTRLYINHVNNFEDINGEGGDALGAWAALSKRGLLAPQDQDFNRFKSLHQLQQVVRKQNYRDELERIKNAEEIEKHKRTKKDVVLIDDEAFYVIIPMNYGACYTFNYSGHNSSFCTGGSSGLRWFQRYAPEGPIVSVIYKPNMNNKDGKWQFHAPTTQLVNSDQDYRHNVNLNDKKFAELYPGLMKSICTSMLAKSQEINEMSKDIRPGGYDVPKDVAEIKETFPVSYASEVKKQAVKESAVTDLEKDLKNPHSYNAIDHMMTSISKKHRITPKKLHDLFVKKHGKIPDDWIKEKSKK